MIIIVSRHDKVQDQYCKMQKKREEKTKQDLFAFVVEMEQRVTTAFIFDSRDDNVHQKKKKKEKFNSLRENVHFFVK